MSLLLLFLSTSSAPSSVGFADVVAHLVDISDLSVSVQELEATRGRTWQELLSAPGAGSITVQNDDPDLASITNQSLIRFDLDNLPRFVVVCEDYDRASISQDEESGEATTWTGRGHLALLERGLVYPAQGPGSLPIEDDRPFNWTSPVYDDSSWAIANQVATIPAAQVAWGLLTIASDFPDATAFMIWGYPGTWLDAPVGDCYFRRDVTLTEEGRYIIYLVIDNYGEVYLDGQLIYQVKEPDTLTFTKTAAFLVDASVGTHTFGVHVVNSAGIGVNPGGFAMAVYKSNPANERVSLTMHSDAAWTVESYPANPPGMTAGEMMRICVEEMQARGVLTQLTLNFSDTTDSEGNTWPMLIDVATAVGTDVLTFFRELSEAFIDMWMDPAALVLSAWIYNGRGISVAATYEEPTDPNDPNTGNITVLSHHGKT